MTVVGSVKGGVKSLVERTLGITISRQAANKHADEALRQLRRWSRIALVQVEVELDQLPKPLLSPDTARAYLAERGYFPHGVYNHCTRRATPPSASPPDEIAAHRPDLLAYGHALFVRADL